MKTSESIVNLAKALLKFHTDLPSIPKNSINPHFKSKFAGLPDIFGVIDKELIKAGLVVIQSPQQGDTHISLLTTVLHAESGEYMESEFSMAPVKKDPQGIGSCITYMRRYALTSILKLNADDDDDGNAASNVNGNGYGSYKPPVKPKGNEFDVQGFIMGFNNCESIEELKTVYTSAISEARKKFSNAEEMINKLCIVKDELKSKWEGYE